MQGQIQKWGNSLGVRLPMQLAKQAHLHSGSHVILGIEHDKITIQPSKKPSKYNLKKMLNGISKKNLHRPVCDDTSKGNEEW
jgi:antitoxin MazE